MDSGKDSLVRRFKWHIVIICAALALVVLLMFTTNIFEPSETNLLRQLVLMLGALMFLVALLTMLSRVFKILDALRDNSTKLEGLTGALEKISQGLAQINHSTRVSETAKVIAFRDADRLSLRQAVFEKLQMQDFDAAYEIIDEIARRPEYGDLAEQLREQADKYQTATDQERLNQMLTHIDKLIDNCQWVRASTQIEELIKAYPDSENAKAMRQNLLDKKEERKRILLAAWDDAVQRQETDRSLEILHLELLKNGLAQRQSVCITKSNHLCCFADAGAVIDFRSFMTNCAFWLLRSCLASGRVRRSRQRLWFMRLISGWLARKHRIGRAAVISLEPQPRLCGGFSSTMHAARRV